MSKATRSTDRRPTSRVAPFAAALASVIVAASSLACVPAEPLPPPQPAAPEPTGLPVEFGYETTDGGRLTSTELRGRFTVIALIATYDFTSQAQLKVLGLVQRDHTPRVNVAAIVLEPPENKPLVIAFAKSLDPNFKVAIADERTVVGRGPFEGLKKVPSIVILDREGREVFRHVGPMDQKPLSAELDRLAPKR